ncbi:MAG: phage head closure protein [Pseudomonadota bacterium]
MNGLTFLDPGTLRHRIVIEQSSEIGDGLGGAVQSWTEWRTVWAHIEPIRADMRERASQTDEWVTHRIHIRQPLELTSDMRFRKGV